MRRQLLLTSIALLLLLQTKTTSAQNFTSLANGFIITRTKVDDQANITLDVRDMFRALEKNDFDTAKTIYENGKHSVIHDSGGNRKGKRTLKKFSTDAYMKYSRNPTFLYHVYGISGSTDKVQWLDYADKFVQDALNDEDSGTLAAEAAVALNVWMNVVHELWDGVYDCRTEENSIEAGVVTDGLEDNEGIGVHAIDEAMAYWIGAGQDMEMGQGFSLFQLAQQAEIDFGVSDDGSFVALTNTDLKELYELCRSFLASSERCFPNSGTWQKLYHITNQMIGIMMVPLMQKLIHSLIELDMDRINLYALAVVPQIAACRLSAHDYLMDKLYFKNDYTDADRVTVLHKLQSAYDCLGISCEDIGAYKTSVIAQCADPPTDLPLAGYKPVSQVHQHSRIDLDVLQIKILTHMEAWPVARLLYELGKNSVISRKKNTYRSLKSMATGKARSVVVPFYDLFRSYNDNPDYADDVIGGALAAAGRYASMSDNQQSEFIVKTLSYQVLYMFALEEFYRALGQCRAGDVDGGMIGYWEKGIAYLIGSIEGPLLGGTEGQDGMLLYNLANERCKQFNTCTEDGYAKIIVRYLELFNAGTARIQEDDCDNLEEIITETAHVLMIPVMQSIIRNAVKNANLTDTSTNRGLAEGEAYAMTILPIIDSHNSTAADVLSRNMVMKPKVQPVQDGPQAVTDALLSVLDHFNSTCLDIGEIEEVVICPAEFQARSGGVRKDRIWSTGVLIIAALVGFVV